MLSGYRLMWMMVMFDLPVLTKTERRDANKFRKFLLDQGFDMCQLSVYMRFCAGKEQTQAYTRRVQAALPPSGNVQIIYLTDKQYANIVSFNGPRRQPANKNPEQYTLF
jgi:CRISPR-associated protein Cas2